MKINDMKQQSSLITPHVQLEGLSLWVHGYQFPEIEDDWDGNWLNVSACCRVEDTEVWVKGPILHLSEIKRWMEECEQLSRTLSGKAALACMEPNLKVNLQMDKLGAIAMTVEITPDHLAQKHQFCFTIDQSYLEKLIRECRQVLLEHPMRENKK